MPPWSASPHPLRADSFDLRICPWTLQTRSKCPPHNTGSGIDIWHGARPSCSLQQAIHIAPSERLYSKSRSAPERPSTRGRRRPNHGRHHMIGRVGAGRWSGKSRRRGLECWSDHNSRYREPSGRLLPMRSLTTCSVASRASRRLHCPPRPVLVRHPARRGRARPIGPGIVAPHR